MKRTNYNLTDHQHRALQVQATHEGISVSELLRKIVGQWMLENGLLVRDYRFLVFLDREMDKRELIDAGAGYGFLEVVSVDHRTLELVASTTFSPTIQQFVEHLQTKSAMSWFDIEIVVRPGLPTQREYHARFRRDGVETYNFERDGVLLTKLVLSNLEFVGEAPFFELRDDRGR